MAKGNFTGTAASAVIVAADRYRDILVLQKTNGLPLALGLGEVAVDGEGIQLDRAGSTVRLVGHVARKAVYGIGLDATGVYQDGNVEAFIGDDLGYGASTVVVFTINGLTNTAKWQSAAVDNSANLFKDALVGGKVKTGTGAGAGDYVDIYVAASADGGTTYSAGASGADASFTNALTDLVFLGRVATIAATTTYEFGPFSVAAAFGGTMPEKWALVLDNESDSTLDASAAEHEVHYMGVR